MHRLPDPLAEDGLDCVQILPHPVSDSSVDQLKGVARLTTCLAKRTFLHSIGSSWLINYSDLTATQGCYTVTAQMLKLGGIWCTLSTGP